MISQKEFDDAMADLVEAEAEIEKLQAALRPLANLPLWRDTYPDARFDNICTFQCIITVKHVRAARAALEGQETQLVSAMNEAEELRRLADDGRVSSELIGIRVRNTFEP